MTETVLTNDSPPATREEWLRRVDAVLKGADFDRKLVGRTYDGLAIQPLYAKAGAADPIRRADPGPWRIAQRMDHPEPAAANVQALADLSGGANSLTLVTEGAASARGFGVSVRNLDDVERALEGVMLDLIHLRIDAGGHGRQWAALIVALAERRGHALSDLSVDFGLDPLGAMAAKGLLSASWDDVAGRMSDTHEALRARGCAGRIFLSDSRAFHEAGASEAQELAAVLSTAIAYLRALESGGVVLDEARDSLAFLLVSDADEFLSLAKFRALRRLWARVEQACGLTPKPIRLHAETAWRMTTKRDPWVNMLRTTIACFSAGLGGADSITVLPFTAALGLPDAFARRVARNTHLILIDEANLARVGDPASGAGGFEALTDALCEKAWALFQAMERDGGLLESLRSGALQRQIQTTREARERAVATRKDPITGTSEFPNLAESKVSVLRPFADRPAGTKKDPAAGGAPKPVSFEEVIGMAASGAPLEDLIRSARGVAPLAIDPLPSIRDALPFERLRDISDAMLARTGSRPKVLLATLGAPATFAARATFAKNAFEAGGIETVTAEASSEEATAFAKSGKGAICLCSSDEVYAESGVSALSALRAVTAAPISLAGRPGDGEKALRDAGVTAFLYAGCDLVSLLDASLDAIEA